MYCLCTHVLVHVCYLVYDICTLLANNQSIHTQKNNSKNYVKNESTPHFRVYRRHKTAPPPSQKKSQHTALGYADARNGTRKVLKSMKILDFCNFSKGVPFEKILKIENKLNKFQNKYQNNSTNLKNSQKI